MKYMFSALKGFTQSPDLNQKGPSRCGGKGRSSPGCVDKQYRFRKCTF